jgi:hypothetical protein
MGRGIVPVGVTVRRVEPLTEAAIRDSFVNCSKGEARRLPMPRPFDGVPWQELDFLGWRDPGAPDRAYLVADRGLLGGGAEGQLVGVFLRASTGIRRSLTRSNVCSICVTSHAGTGVSLLAARRAGAAGREGNTIGLYMCADLACSLYTRGRKHSAVAERLRETLTLDEQIDRLRRNLSGFLAQVLA